MTIAGVAVVVLAAAGCSSTPTQEEAEASVCESVASVQAAADDIRTLDASSTVDEAEAARASLDAALLDLQESAATVGEADTAALDAAAEAIGTAVDSVAGSDTISGAAAAVKASSAALETAVTEISDGYGCQ